MAATEGRSRADDPEHFLITVNQVVSYNLGRARRSRGWTQEETAERLEAASGKKWTSATLSASERAIKTGRPRVFDANELVTFARVFEYPVAYFLLPIEPKGKQEIVYALSRLQEQDGRQRDPLLNMMDLLHTSVPLRYPAEMIDAVNRLLSSKSIVWQPSARVEWDEGDADYDDAVALQHRDDEFTLAELKTTREFAQFLKKHRSSNVMRLLADVMDETQSRTPSEDLTDQPPF